MGERMGKKQIRKNILSQMKDFDKKSKHKADIWLMKQLIENEKIQKCTSYRYIFVYATRD